MGHSPFVRERKIFWDLSSLINLSYKGWKSERLAKISWCTMIDSHQLWLIPWGGTLCSPVRTGLNTGLLLSMKREDGSWEAKRVCHRYLSPLIIQGHSGEWIWDTFLVCATTGAAEGVVGAGTGHPTWFRDGAGKVTAKLEPEGWVRIS